MVMNCSWASVWPVTVPHAYQTCAGSSGLAPTGEASAQAKARDNPEAAKSTHGALRREGVAMSGTLSVLAHAPRPPKVWMSWRCPRGWGQPGTIALGTRRVATVRFRRVGVRWFAFLSMLPRYHHFVAASGGMSMS